MALIGPISVTTAAGGGGTGESTIMVAGHVQKVICIQGTLDNSFTALFQAVEQSGLATEDIIQSAALSADTVLYPRVKTHEPAASADIEYASGYPVYDKAYVEGKIKVTVVSGGATKTGTFYVYYTPA